MFPLEGVGSTTCGRLSTLLQVANLICGVPPRRDQGLGFRGSHFLTKRPGASSATCTWSVSLWVLASTWQEIQGHQRQMSPAQVFMGV